MKPNVLVMPDFLPVHNIPHALQSDYLPPHHREALENAEPVRAPWCPFCYYPHSAVPGLKWFGLNATISFRPLEAFAKHQPRDPRPFDRMMCGMCNGVIALTYPLGGKDAFLKWLRDQAAHEQPDSQET